MKCEFSSAVLKVPARSRVAYRFEALVSSPRPWMVVCCVAGLSALLPAQLSFAGPLFRATASHWGAANYDIESDEGTHSAAIDGFADIALYGHNRANYRASADPGVLRAYADSHQPPGTSVGTLESIALMRFDDVIITAFDPAATEVTARLNLAISGSFSRGGGDANGRLKVGGCVPGFEGVFGEFIPSFNVNPINGNTGMFSGVASGADGVDGIFATRAFTAPVGTPFRLDVYLSTAVDPESDGATVVGDFGSSLHFPVGSPVFDLPAGFTADSVQAGIADNSFGAATAVPEPGSLALFGTGIVSLWGYAWRRQRFAER